MPAEDLANAEAARKYLESELWPNGAVCPHCGAEGCAAQLKPTPGARTHARWGTWNCRQCRKQFSVTVGTILEDSRIPLYKWLRAFEIFQDQPAVSAAEVQRDLQLGSYRTARFLLRRLRWAANRMGGAVAVTAAGVAAAGVTSTRGGNFARALLAVRPDTSMPRPGRDRGKSVWAEISEELGE